MNHAASQLFSLILFSYVANSQATETDIFFDLAKSLETDLKSERVRIGVGNFAFENTPLLSAFSSLLRDELEIALNKIGKFEVVTRDRLADLELEGKFQGQTILEPGTEMKNVSIAGVEAIVRGRYYTTTNEITIFTEIVWLDGAKIQKSKITIPMVDAKATIWPNSTQIEKQIINDVLEPQNAEKSLANVEDITNGRLFKVKEDFHVEVTTSDGRRAYPEKENIGFRVRSSEQCHIAVLCHQNDGTTVVLFPNQFSQNTLIPANKPIDVPGTHKSDFEIEVGPPFGSDVVEVIACSEPTELHKMLATKASAKNAKPFETMTRGMAVKGIQSSLIGTSQTAERALKWGHSHIVISTYPHQNL